MYRITYVRTEWSKPWEMEDYGDVEQIDCGSCPRGGVEDWLEGMLPGEYIFNPGDEGLAFRVIYPPSPSSDPTIPDEPHASDS